MRDYLRNEISNDELYEVTPRLKAHELLVHLKTLRDRVSEYDNPDDCPFKELVDFLELEYGDLTTKLDGMIKEGVVRFHGPVCRPVIGLHFAHLALFRLLSHTSGTCLRRVSLSMEQSRTLKSIWVVRSQRSRTALS
jgi:hypothetical protein